MKRTIITCAISCLLVFSLAVETQAEVRVHTRVDGEYEEVTIVPGGPPWNQGVWSGSRIRRGLRRGSSVVLNPLGDRFGDRVPIIVESSRAPHHPWAVWSRFNGNDYDLVYSSWAYAWNRISPVTPDSIEGDDLDPSLTFNREARPLLAWWNRDAEDGHGTVFFSMFHDDGWIQPVQISDDILGGRYPSISIEHGRVLISYESDDGSTQITYQFRGFDPTTITDDIDPQTAISEGEADVLKDPVDKD